MRAAEAIRELAEKLEDPALRDTAITVIADWVERRMAIDAGKPHPTSRETLEWTYMLLKRLSDVAPLGILRPLK